jgi:hypothetical protein
MNNAQNGQMKYFRVVLLALRQLCHDNCLHITLMHSISPFGLEAAVPKYLSFAFPEKQL